MALTKDFKETVKVRLDSDPEFRRALLEEGVDLLLSGDVGTGRAVLRDYINGTIGFRPLSEETAIPEKSLIRMFGDEGNPTAQNLFAVIEALQRHEGVELAVTAKAVA